MNTVLVYSCDSANVDATTGQCSQPVWSSQPAFLPSLSATDGGLIGAAIMACWAAAYMSRALKQAGS